MAYDDFGQGLQRGFDRGFSSFLDVLQDKKRREQQERQFQQSEERLRGNFAAQQALRERADQRAAEAHELSQDFSELQIKEGHQRIARNQLDAFNAIRKMPPGAPKKFAIKRWSKLLGGDPKSDNVKEFEQLFEQADDELNKTLDTLLNDVDPELGMEYIRAVRQGTIDVPGMLQLAEAASTRKAQEAAAGVDPETPLEQVFKEQGSRVGQATAEQRKAIGDLDYQEALAESSRATTEKTRLESTQIEKSNAIMDRVIAEMGDILIPDPEKPGQTKIGVTSETLQNPNPSPKDAAKLKFFANKLWKAGLAAGNTDIGKALRASFSNLLKLPAYQNIEAMDNMRIDLLKAEQEARQEAKLGPAMNPRVAQFMGGENNLGLTQNQWIEKNKMNFLTEAQVTEIQNDEQALDSILTVSKQLADLVEPATVGPPGRFANFVERFSSGIEGFATQLGINQGELKTWDNYARGLIGKESGLAILKRAGVDSALVQNQILNLGYRVAALRGSRGRSLSDTELRQILESLGAAASEKQFKSVIRLMAYQESALLKNKFKRMVNPQPGHDPNMIRDFGFARDFGKLSTDELVEMASYANIMTPDVQDQFLEDNRIGREMIEEFRRNRLQVQGAN
jgi:hypothetical protein